MAEGSGMSFSKSNENPEDNKEFPKNLKKMSKLFVNMKLNEGTKLEKMDTELKEISKIPISEVEDKQFCVAGKIISFLEKISVILVKPSQSDNELLNIGTNLFLRTRDNWIVLGQIDEIFGNIKDPLYAVSLFPTENHLFKLEDTLYFLVDASTSFHIECNNYSKYSVVYHS